MTSDVFICIVGLLTCYPFFGMTPECSNFDHSEKSVASLSMRIEASCAPMFGEIRSSLAIEVTSEKIIQFAEKNNVKKDAVQLAVHICELLLEGIRDEQNGNPHIHTRGSIREKIRYITTAHTVQSKEIVALHGRYNLPLKLQPELLTLAKQFLEQL